MDVVIFIDPGAVNLASYLDHCVFFFKVASIYVLAFLQPHVFTSQEILIKIVGVSRCT